MRGPDQPRSRVGLLAWFAAQWIVIPVESVLRLAWNAALFCGDGVPEDAARATDPLARFLGPRRLALEWSRKPARWERHLERLLARLAVELRDGDFSLATRICHRPRVVAVKGEHAPVAHAVLLNVRDYRGAAPGTVARIAAGEGLVAVARRGNARRLGMDVRLRDPGGE
ncbi:hypothetical protein ACOKM3_09905 [Streptomyces sp. BH106]|uniref:hypothetical protein n=1 Tax=Streptomyces sp. BH106 TaxID=3410409 RepID=UPI003CF3DD1C